MKSTKTENEFFNKADFRGRIYHKENVARKVNTVINRVIVSIAILIGIGTLLVELGIFLFEFPARVLMFLLGCRTIVNADGSKH